MSLILEIPTEVENEVREVAKRRGREIGDFILELALMQMRREEEERRLRLEALQEMTRISEELGLYEWELDVTSNRAT